MGGEREGGCEEREGGCEGRGREDVRGEEGRMGGEREDVRRRLKGI